jgi:hypothetical protein
VEKLPDGSKITGMIADHNLHRGSPAALWNAFEKKQAIVLLAGSRYQGFPFRFDEKCRYFVLGWYAITHAWCYPERNVLPSTPDSAIRTPGQGTSCEIAAAKVNAHEDVFAIGIATRSMFRFQWLPDAPGSTPWWDRFNSPSPSGAKKVDKDANRYIQYRVVNHWEN